MGHGGGRVTDGATPLDEARRREGERTQVKPRLATGPCEAAPPPFSEDALAEAA